MQERTRLENAIKACQKLESEMNDHIDLIELGEAEGDDEVVRESEVALAALAAEAERMEVETLLSGEADSNDAYIEVHAGAGGTESQDWASMLQRMYMRWAEKKGYSVSLIEETSGEEAGIKSTTIEIKGHNAYGWAKTESGCIVWCVYHRLTVMRAAIPALPVWAAIRWLMMRLRLMCLRPMCVLILSAPQGRAVSM